MVIHILLYIYNTVYILYICVKRVYSYSASAAIVQVDECRRPVGLFTVQGAAMAHAVNCMSSSAVANTATPNYLLWCTCSLQRAGLKLAYSAQGNQSSLQLCK